MSKVYSLRLSGQVEDDFLLDMSRAGFTHYADYLRYLISGGNVPGRLPLHERLDQQTEELRLLNRGIVNLSTAQQVERLIEQVARLPAVAPVVSQSSPPNRPGKLDWEALDEALFKKSISPQSRKTFQEVLKEFGYL
ncbi:hypothetical protein [Chitinimonas sp. BJB300]|uniref:hypothetical protein n=1 Tax=Chitinimonas sp. BJB300 TaxID=1559339 RepID=UPI000C107788|nr:hypothetical protein [Chitinimonas sp. BJB300]PHV12026.1 hypothetical protein CSQ89_07750 [Chitinimonas sp. BJB300]TSJ84933.1 hypothetical protein FG002_018415 [Chitinimonas sp. BJB300]